MNNKLNNLKIKIDGQEYEFQGGSGGKVFENATELPSNPDSNVIYRVGSAGGTVVPNTGLVDNVYFNTSLSIEEVIELVKNSGITFIDLINEVPSTEQGLYVVYGTVDSKGTVGDAMQIIYGESFIESMFGTPARLVILAVVYPKDENGDYTNEESMLPIFVSDDVSSMGLTAGWQGIDSIEIGDTLINDLDGFSVGSENDKLTNLFSLTSNFSSVRYINIVDGKEFEFVDKNSIAKIKNGTLFFDDKFVNSAVPNSGYVDNIYFNTDLTAEEVTAILDKIPDSAYFELMNEYAYFIAVRVFASSASSSGTASETVYVYKKIVNDKNAYIIYYGDGEKDTSGTATRIFDTIESTGWAEDFNGTIEYNGVTLSIAPNFDVAVGTYNDILTDLVYVKPKQEPISKIQYQGKSYVLSPFEDVKELPSNPNTGTIYRIKATNKPVPSDGSTIGTVYFNTNLSISEVIGKINSYDIPWVDSSVFGWPSLELYPICMFDGSSFELFNNDPYVALIFSRTKADHSAVIITFACFATGKFVDIFLSTGSGWSGTGLVSNAMQQINIPVNGITEFQGLSIGTHNNLIKDIISSNGLFNSDTKYYNYDGENVNLLNKNSEEYTIELQHKYNMTLAEFKSSLEAYELPKEVINNFYEYNVKLLIKDTDVNGYTTDYYFDLVDSEYTQGENESLGVSGVELRFSRITRDKIQYIKISNAYVLAEGIHTLVKNNAYYDDIYIAGNVHTVDTSISDSSTNPVQNKVIKEYVDSAITSAIGSKLEGEY